ncbi:MAG: TetR/AcrR family transcriptional regulator [Proteobacteria bacterium]|nr:TetR/AcrR family transcriptional regulator [Pseudomonadota bacterium]
MGRISKAEQKREQIIWALRDLLSERGHESITIKDIASRAGVPHGVIHYYFKSKVEIYSCLVKAIQKHYDKLWEERRNTREAAPSTGAGLSDPEFMIDKLVFNSNFGRVFYNLLHMGFEHEEIKKALLDMYRHYHAELTRVFEIDGAGENSQALASLVQAIVEGLTILRSIDKDALGRDRALGLLTWAISSCLSKSA